METTVQSPFDFVPYPARVARRPPHTHERPNGATGRLTCELEALSPLLVMSSEHRAGHLPSQVGQFQQTAREVRIVPGTSLKGMVRSVFEVLTGSCVPLSTGKTRGFVPRDVEACRDPRQLCPACRTFGFLSGGQVHRGLVNIGDAREVPGTAVESRDLQLVPLESPKPDRNPRYADGRKAYYHQPGLLTAATDNDRARGPWVRPVLGRSESAPGATFRFDVAFTNLPADDLAAFVAALVLTDTAAVVGRPVRVRHKLGYGKPAGLGSVEVRVTGAELASANRYALFSAAPEVLAGDALAAWVDERRRAVFGAPSPPVEALSRILRFPPEEGVSYAYPAYTG